MRTLQAGLVAVLVSGSAAAAGTFEVKTPEVTKGETEVGVNSAHFSGYPVNADPLRRSFELGAAHTPTDWFKIGAKINLDQETGSSLQAVTAGVEVLAVVRKLENGFGFGWYGSLDGALRSTETNSLTFGPIFQFGTEKTSLTLNPFFVRTFGQNSTEGVDFAYGWQAKHEIREGLAFGIEGFGVVPNIGNAPGTAFQEHRIGPVVYFSRELKRQSLASIKDAKGGDSGSQPKFNAEIGVYRGLTDGTQDWALKVKGGFTF